ncbi:MAG: O-antigen ligase family protein [Candidatus Omnitrophica bacterium]|nr:O-antigen ligase family protein [Candidatus Omnitrophota bacterium]
MPITLKGLKKLALYVLLYFSVIKSLHDEKRIKGFVFILVFSAAIVSVDGLYQLMQGKDWFSGRALMSYPQLDIKRITSSFHQAGSLGIYIGLVLPLALSLFLFYSSRLTKWLLGISICLMLPVLILTYAPGAALGLYAAIIIMAICKRKWWLVALLLVGLIFGFFLLPESLTSWPHGGFFTSIAGRINMWKTALKIIQVHPFIGSGLHSFSINYENFCLPGQPHCGAGAPYAHNMYLQMAAEIGLLGLGVFIWILAFTFKKLFNIFKSASSTSFMKALSLGLTAGMAAYLTHGILESSIYTSQGALLFWTMLGLSHGLISLMTLQKIKV